MGSYPRFETISYGLALVFFGCFFISFIGCSEEKRQKQIITVSDQEAGQEAKEIRNQTSVTTPEDLEVSLWASEKLLDDPVAIDINNKGQAFITVTNRSSSSEIEIRRHRRWMINSISWDKVEDRKNFLHEELTPERSEHNTEWLPDRNGDGSHDWRDLTVQKEEIYRIEDKSGDGRADFSQLFFEGFNDEESDVAGAVFSDNDDLFVGVAPDMWRLKDTDNDGMADKKESISYGYGIHMGYAGHGMSGATMGPDGRLYWGIGDSGINITGPNGKQWYYPNQGVTVRSEPDGSNFEIFARGVRNTHEFTFDKYGNLITVDNDGDHAGEHERLVYLINGSDSGWRTNWQFGKYEDPKNNNYKVWMDENYFKPRFDNQAAHLLPPLTLYHSGPAGMAYNPGTALNEKWNDHFFVMEFTGAAYRSFLHAFTLKPKGASFELETDKEVMNGILATGIDFGPDGALYLADWVSGWRPNESGRIWKLDDPLQSDSKIRTETKKLLNGNFEDYSEDRLQQLIKHPDMRVRTKTQFELVDRGAADLLLNIIRNQDHQLARVHGIWGIGQLARKDVDEAKPLMQYLNDQDAEIRAQTARILGDVRYEPAVQSLTPLLKDGSARVRLFATQGLGRIGDKSAVRPIINMLEDNDDQDVYLRHAGAIALSRIGDSESLAALADHPSRAVRIAAVVALRRMKDPGVARFLNDRDEFIVTNAARAINDDQFINEAIPQLAAMVDQNKFINGPLIRRAINACLYNGRKMDAERLARFATREGVPQELRAEALATLGVWSDPSTLDRVTGRYRGKVNNNLQDAIVAFYSVSSVIDSMLKSAEPALKNAAVKTISRLDQKYFQGSLLNLVKNDQSPEVRITVLEALQEMKYDQIDEAVKIAQSDSNQEVRMTALKLIPSLELSDEKAVELLTSVLGGNTIIEQQTALKTLGKIRDEAAYKVLLQQLDLMKEGKLAPELQVDLIEAIEATASGKLKKELEQYQSAKPEGDQVAAFREVLKGGDIKKGQQDFYFHQGAQCVRCHAIRGRGGDVGPDLTTIGDRLTREQLLESMVEPSARIAPGFGLEIITLKSGQKVQGTLLEETRSFLTLQTAPGDTTKIPKDNITKRRNTPSSMPPMGDILSRSELRNLIEFLNSRVGS